MRPLAEHRLRLITKTSDAPIPDPVVNDVVRAAGREFSSVGLYPPATYELLRTLSFADDKRYMRVPLIDFDYRLVVLSSFIVIIAMYATLALVERMKSAQGAGWFAWLGGGASGTGIGIWSMHYVGLQTLGLPVPWLNCSSVLYSILATILASGFTLLIVSGKSDSGRGVKEESRRPIRLAIFIRQFVKL